MIGALVETGQANYMPRGPGPFAWSGLMDLHTIEYIEELLLYLVVCCRVIGDRILVGWGARGEDGLGE